MKLALSVGLFFGLVCCIESAGLRLTGQALIDHINGQNLPYKVKLNKKFANMSEEQRNNYFVRKPDPKSKLPSPKRTSSAKSSVNITTVLPDSFDIAEKWPKCSKVFNRIKDQGSCPNAVWALGGASILTDRRCIVSDGKFKVPISAWDALTCINIGAQKTAQSLCHDKSAGIMAVFYAYGEGGLVTGGTYGGFGCKTYPINDQTDINTLNFTCIRECRKEYKTRSYANDIQKGPAYDHYIEDGIASFKQEIMTYGSIGTTFSVSTADFLYYSSGVYVYNGNYSGVGDGFVDGRITGWGIENGIPYWKVASHIGYDFGDRGFFKYKQLEYQWSADAPLVE